MASTYACPNGAQTLPDSLRGLSASPFYDCAVYFFLISNTLDSTYNLMGNFKETLIESFFFFLYKVKMVPIIVLIDFFLPLSLFS